MSCNYNWLRNYLGLALKVWSIYLHLGCLEGNVGKYAIHSVSGLQITICHDMNGPFHRKMNLENSGNHTGGISTCLTLKKTNLGLSSFPEQRCIRIPEPKKMFNVQTNPSGGEDCILRRQGYSANYTFQERFSVTWMLSPLDLHPCRENETKISP